MATHTARMRRPFHGIEKADKSTGLPAFKLSHALRDEDNARRLSAYCNRLARTPESLRWRRKWASRLRLRTRLHARHGIGTAAGVGGAHG